MATAGQLELKYVWQLTPGGGGLKGYVFKAHGIDAVGRLRRAPSHTAGLTKGSGVVTVNLPPYSPERIFEELRRRVEGQVYGGLRLPSVCFESLRLRACRLALDNRCPRLTPCLMPNYAMSVGIR